MNRLLDDDDLRRELVERGLVRARQFDWPSAAAELEQVYRSVLDEVRPR
jgi:glycosyltransferase involved in cell wall biosynthesis